MSETRSRSPPSGPRSAGAFAGKNSGKVDSKERNRRSRSRSDERSHKDRDRRNNDRTRSRSPHRHGPSKRKDTGFKWKDKRKEDDNQNRDRDEGLRRGYREHYRPRSRSRSPRRREGDRRRGEGGERERKEDRSRGEELRERPEKKEKQSEKDKKAPPVAAPVIPQQPMIIVTVNDRLGTKKQIPCFPTDSVKDFKIIVASMIGRKPHEILLKRQGERPFKDVLTLQDYGVSNNVQLDLEVDTGD